MLEFFLSDNLGDHLCHCNSPSQQTLLSLAVWEESPGLISLPFKSPKQTGESNATI